MDSRRDGWGVTGRFLPCYEPGEWVGWGGRRYEPREAYGVGRCLACVEPGLSGCWASVGLELGGCMVAAARDRRAK